MAILIAEVGNNHFGDFDKAKEMIRVAYESGADLVKFQAFLPGAISGSMPAEFYTQCAFTLEQYIELIQYGKGVGIDVFHTIFSPELAKLISYQNWIKFAGSQTQKKETQKLLRTYDQENVFLSVRPDRKPLPLVRYANVLYVSDYLAEDPVLDYMDELRRHYERPIGYSDHTIGTDWVKSALLDYGAHVIEKHFTLTRDMKFKGHTFRDTVHGALPWELEIIATMTTAGGLRPETAENLH